MLSVSLAFCWKETVKNMQKPQSLYKVCRLGNLDNLRQSYKLLICQRSPQLLAALWSYVVFHPCLQIPCWWCTYVAYAAGSERDSDENSAWNSSFDTVLSTRVSGTSRTDTGRDRLQYQNDSTDGDTAVVCPSGEVVDVVVKSESVANIGHNSHKCSSMLRSCSMPSMCSHPSSQMCFDSKSINAELQYLSTYAKLQQFPTSPLENSKNGCFAKSPYMSPLLASDGMLQLLCPIHLIVRFCIQFLSLFVVVYG